MQINRTGKFLIGFFFFGGFAFTIVEFTVLPFPIGLGPIWMVVAIGLGIYSKQQDKRGAHEQMLWKTGVRGRGTLVEASSNVKINDQPKMKLVLDLDVPGQSPRQIRRSVIVSDFAAHRMKPGLVLPVCVDPADPDDVLIVW